MFKGITDLAGLGKLANALRGFVMDLLRHWAERENRELKNEELRLKNQDREIKNKAASVRLVQSVFAASKKCGCSPEELLEIIARPTSPAQMPTTKSEPDILPDRNPKLLGE